MLQVVRLGGVHPALVFYDGFARRHYLLPLLCEERRDPIFILDDVGVALLQLDKALLAVSCKVRRLRVALFQLARKSKGVSLSRRCRRLRAIDFNLSELGGHVLVDNLLRSH